MVVVVEVVVLEVVVVEVLDVVVEVEPGVSVAPGQFLPLALLAA